MDAATSTTIGPIAEGPSPTVFIVDDDGDIQQAIALLARSAGFASETFPSAQKFLDRYDGRQPGCLVLDIRMPGMSGLELQQILNLRDVRPTIIFITGHGDIPLITQGIRDGALDVIPKPFNAETLLKRIHEAILLDLANRDKRHQVSEIQSRMNSLTDREREVMRLLAAGESAKQIGQKLCISSKTVDNHRAKSWKKFAWIIPRNWLGNWRC
jgi:two-component system, LuxR family, response regulator FixJ